MGDFPVDFVFWTSAGAEIPAGMSAEECSPIGPRIHLYADAGSVLCRSGYRALRSQVQLSGSLEAEVGFSRMRGGYHIWEIFH